MGRKPGKDVRIAVAGGQVAHGAHVAHQVRHQPLRVLASQMARHKPLLVTLFIAAPHLLIKTSTNKSVPSVMKGMC